MMMHSFVIVATLLTLAVGCTSQGDSDVGVETGDDNNTVDAMFESWDKPGSPGCALAVAQVAENRFEIDFHPQGWSEPQSVRLEFNRNGSGEITGFRLSSGSERGIVFEKRL